MESYIFGQSANNLPIIAYDFGRIGPKVLVLGGVHGDEPEGITAAQGLLARWAQSFPFNLRATLVPTFNPDGAIRLNRLNGNGVDLNRNMSTRDWSPKVATPRYNPGVSADSENETKALVKWISIHQPKLVISLHSWHPMLNINGDCEVEAKAIASLTGYKVEPTIGYPTPGCLGTYCGLERQMPTITYEIERGLATAEILKTHLPAIEEGLKAFEFRQDKNT